MDEGKLRDQAERAERAKRLLEDELLNEAFAKLDTALMKAWKESPPSEPERREDAWRCVKLLEKLQGELNHIVYTGKDARKRLLELKDPSLIERLRNG